ncbi:Mob1/phocein [Bombardia bombarda]|uniref:Mob1/phocein n=1 Tax=Bombardia bombarda TaxID=252184 RepID=A0AA39X9M5_9PEZI|nr:Mob1/phocein [Bombardia bombarda]
MSLPPSSPRLPSPPPPAEIQIGPKSPSMGPNSTRQAQQIEQTAIDANAKRRIHPGTKSADMAAGPPLVPIQELDSAFQLQEHLAALHYYHTLSNTSPITRETAKLLTAKPLGIDETLWLYELCRFLIAQCNSLIVGFLFDTPPCSAVTCPEMRASEWQFLCAVHDAPKSCCAIDYCCHTLDWAANVVTNPKIFPSRFVVDSHDKNTAHKNLVNVFRRLHRIFAHAWFQHRGVFWSVEGQTGLYLFFKTVCDHYQLLPAENYKLPPEAEGLDTSSAANALSDTNADKKQQLAAVPASIAKPPSGQRGEADDDNSNLSRTNTRRHIKSSPSTGNAITTVIEADEDDGDVASKLAAMHLSAPGVGDEEISVRAERELVDQPPLRSSSVIPPETASTFTAESPLIPEDGPMYTFAPMPAEPLSELEQDTKMTEGEEIGEQLPPPLFSHEIPQEPEKEAEQAKDQNADVPEKTAEIDFVTAVEETGSADITSHAAKEVADTITSEPATEPSHNPEEFNNEPEIQEGKEHKDDSETEVKAEAEIEFKEESTDEIEKGTEPAPVPESAQTSKEEPEEKATDAASKEESSSKGVVSDEEPKPEEPKPEEPKPEEPKPEEPKPEEPKAAEAEVEPPKEEPPTKQETKEE